MKRDREQTQGAQEGDQEHDQSDHDGNRHDLPPYYYVLGEENRPRRVGVLEWSERQPHFLWRTRIAEGVSVSTIFHGFDMDYWCREAPEQEPELLFATKIFGGVLHGEETLALTYEEAREYHVAAVHWVRSYQAQTLSSSGVTS